MLISKLQFFVNKQAPEPAESWRPAVLDAFEHSKICVQPAITVMHLPYPQGEDCLTLNVYVPGKHNLKVSVT